MDELYRKITYPSGKVRYIPSCTYFDTGDPADGIWYIKREKYGRSFKWLVEHLEDLPKARTLAELEPLRDAICKAILQVKLGCTKTKDGHMITVPCANDICDAIFKELAEPKIRGEQK